MYPPWFRSVSAAAVLLCTFAVSACSSDQPSSTSSGSTADSAGDGNNDPFESVNRKVFVVDIALKDYILTPIARGYRAITPEFFQTAVTSAVRNLASPAILANDLLEGNMKRAGITLARIEINTLAGVGGLIDVAATQNLPYHDADFGATLGAWGIPSGPYLVLPLLGPSDPRDGIGMGVDTVLFDPFNIKTRAAGIDSAPYYRLGVTTVDAEARTQDDFDELRKSSLDLYAAVRSLYQQKRGSDVATAKNPNAPPPAPADEVEPSGPVPSNQPAGAGSTKAH
jgi:phospholipid-binding lipoprotein MlaA